MQPCSSTLLSLLLSTSLASQAASGWHPDESHRVLTPGVTVGAHYFADWSGVFKGGVRNRDTYRSLSEVHVTLDSEPLVDWKGTVLFLDAYSQAGRDGSLDTGDLQAYSNLDGPNRTQVASLWIEHTFPGERLRLKVGKVDANKEFAALPHGGDFIHSSAGFPPTILGFPTYPDPAFSVNAFATGPQQAGDLGWRIAVGVYDGATAEGTATGPRGPATFFDDGRSDAYFLIADGGLTWPGGSAAIGAWHHTADLQRFGGGVERGTSGWYAWFDQRLYAESRDGEDGQGLFVMASFGLADEEVSVFARNHAAGLYLVGGIPGRDRDSAGFFLSHAEVSDLPGSGASGDETAFELFYRAQITEHLFVQPVLQYIRHPAAVNGVAKAVVGTLRFEFRW